MRKKFILPVILSLLIFINIFVVLQVSYAFFGNLDSTSNSIIKIGNWLYYIPEPDNVKEYVEEIRYPEDEEIANYVLETLGDVNGDEFVIDDTFKDYTMSEIIEIVDLIEEFTQNFLENNNGNMVFPNSATVQPVDLNNVGKFAPGDVQFIKHVFQTANYANTTDWTPITFQLILESPEGYDLSDFSIEIVPDFSPFAQKNPFAYDYMYNDYSRNYYKTVHQSTISANKLSNLPLMGNVEYVNRAFNVDRNQELRFLHQYSAPDMTGEWKRFPEGANLFFDRPKTGGHWSGLKQQFYLENDPQKKAGMTLSGRTDGTKVEIMFNLNQRIPRSSNSLPVIPMLIIISRGIEVDNNKNPLTQRTDLITPTIKFRVVEGNVWDND